MNRAYVGDRTGTLFEYSMQVWYMLRRPFPTLWMDRDEGEFEPLASTYYAVSNQKVVCSASL